MIRQFELVERVKAYDPAADEDALNRAYVFAMKAHGSQSRASGDPYFSHPLGVAELLARMKLDSASIVTGLPGGARVISNGQLGISPGEQVAGPTEP